jgi:hypothetical protein
VQAQARRAAVRLDEDRGADAQAEGSRLTQSRLDLHLHGGRLIRGRSVLPFLRKPRRAPASCAFPQAASSSNGGFPRSGPPRPTSGGRPLESRNRSSDAPGWRSSAAC